MSQPTNTSTAAGGAAAPALVLPNDKVLQQATKLSLKTKKPICFYFYIDSLKGKISIVSDGEDRIIFKNEDEHTSPILNTYKSENCYIIVTENTIYILSADTKVM
jgi:hypothetical protein